MIKIDERTLLIGSLILVGSGLGIWGYRYSSLTREMAGVRLALTQNFTALAVERIEPIRNRVLKRKDGCSLMIDTYFPAKRSDRLEWAAEACLEANPELPEAYLGLSASYELRGLDRDSLPILQAASKKFDKIAGFSARIAQLFRRNKDLKRSAQFYMEAVNKAPNDQGLALEALGLFIEAKEDVGASQLAARLKAAKTDNPEVKLVIARGLKRGPDRAGAKAMVEDALVLIGKNEDLKKQLHQSYSDLL